jgi:hypothetical protein
MSKLITRTIKVLIGFLTTCICFTSLAQNKPGCLQATSALISPFLGTWDEYDKTDKGETFIGRLVTTRAAGDCGISQKFISKDSSLIYQSLGFTNPASKLMVETYVFNSGAYSIYYWFADGKDVIQRRIGGSRLTDGISQLRLQLVSPNEYRALEEVSMDGGESWQVKNITMVRKVE